MPYEQPYDRERREEPNSPRTLDVDVIAADLIDDRGDRLIELEQVAGQRMVQHDDALRPLRRAAEDRGLTVTVACPPGARFAGERQDLEEILGNLLENAVKYAVSRIRVEVAEAGEQLAVTVADDGPGMADADHARALSRGGRLDEMGPPGAGLGLAIVADLAALRQASDAARDFFLAAPGGVRTTQAFSTDNTWSSLDTDAAEGCIRDMAHAFSKEGGLAVATFEMAKRAGALADAAGLGLHPR